VSSARIGAFAQRVARIIVQREVAVAHEGGDFKNMKVLSPFLGIRLPIKYKISF
jgi:hypothetical protein